MGSKAIYKYPLAATDVQVLHLPRGAKILSVIVQRESICLYAEVEIDRNDCQEDCYEIRVHGTGHQLGEDIDNFSFLGTILLYGGQLVFHVFYRKT